jgi:hypothetical protein
MIDQIGRLLDQTPIPLPLGGQDDLDRLFADLLDDLVLAGGQQPRRVRVVR